MIQLDLIASKCNTYKLNLACRKSASTNAYYADLLIVPNALITFRRARKGAAAAAMDDDIIAVDYD
jgi:hypothetical protein